MADIFNDWQADLSLKKSNLYMLEHNVATDVKFAIHSEKTHSWEYLEAHKFMLISRSTVFYTMFCGSLKPDNSPIVITDIPRSVFNDMLIFLYTGDVEIKSDNVLSLFYAADKYMISALTKKVCGYLENAITPHSISLILSQAVLYDQEGILNRCLDVLKASPSESCKWLENHHISHAALQVIVEDDEVISDETDLFIYCNNWATKESRLEKLKPTIQNRRQVLGDVLYKIRVPTISSKDVATKITPLQLLTQDDELDIYRFVCGQDGTVLKFPATKRSPPFVVKDWGPQKLCLYSGCDWQLCGFKFAVGYHPKITINKEQMKCCTKILTHYYVDRTSLLYNKKGVSNLEIKLAENLATFKIDSIQGDEIKKVGWWNAVVDHPEKWPSHSVGQYKVLPLRIDAFSNLIGIIYKQKLG